MRPIQALPFLTIPLVPLTVGAILAACGPKTKSPPGSADLQVERQAVAPIPVVVYEIPTGTQTSHVSEFTDQHGRLCTVVYYGGRVAIDCDFPRDPSK